MGMIRIMMWLSFLLLIVSSSRFVTGEKSSTEKKRQPICFVSEINATSPSTPTLLRQQQNNNINNFTFDDLKESVTFESLSSSPVLRIFPRCFDGTEISGKFSYEPHVHYLLDQGQQDDEQGIIYTDTTYTFTISFTVNLTAIAIVEHIDLDALGGKNVSCVSRFLICDALQLGECSPLIRTLLNDNATISVDTTNKKKQSWTVAAPSSGRGREKTSDDDASLSSYSVHYFDLSNLGHHRADDDMYRAEVNITLKIPSSQRYGANFFIGDTIIDFPTINSTNIIKRINIAMALPDHALYVRDPPLIQTVSPGIKIYLAVIIGITGSFALSCFIFILYHRKNPVMMLAQSPLLAALAGSSFTHILFSFAYLPTNDIFCNMTGPLTLIPIHLSAAIMVGRMWRTYTILGAANLIGRRSSLPPSTDLPNNNAATRRNASNCRSCDAGMYVIDSLTFLGALPFKLCCCREGTHAASKTPKRSVKRKVTAKETASLICMLTFPQLFLQVFGAAYYDRVLEIQFDLDADAGRYVCSTNGKWLQHLGIGFVSLLYILAIIVAWISRMLPSAFNETSQVFRAAGIVSILTAVIIPLWVLTDVPAVSPNVTVFFRSLLSIGIALTNLCFIVLPKIVRVWTGEKVVISSLLESKYVSSKSPASPAAQDGSEIPTLNGSQAKKNDGDQDEEDLRPTTVLLNDNDPIPSAVSEQVLRVQGVLRRVTDEYFDGRPLTSKNWERMRSEIDTLQAELGHYEFERRSQVSWQE